MICKKLVVTCLLLGSMLVGHSAAHAKSIYVRSVDEFQAAQDVLVPGDSLVWEEGKFENLQLVLSIDSIFFTSATDGGTIFSGSSSLKVSGSHNVVSGFQYIGGKIKGDVVDVYGSYNRIDNVNIHSYDSHYYLRVRPNCQHNILSNCKFEAKPESQESSVVQIEATEDLPGYHLVTHCSFKNHTAPAGAGGDFGIEALRIGYSYQRMFIGRNTVEYCYFEKCNGDYEVISCKARENLMRYNTFINNGPAHLTLRHGSRNTVYGNFFINGAGVRVKEGQNHCVINNYFDTGDEFAIHLQNHHFDPVDTVVLINNTIVGESKILLGGTGDYPPGHVIFIGNLFSGKVDATLTDPTETERWVSNAVRRDGGPLPPDGFVAIPITASKNQVGLMVPQLAPIDWKYNVKQMPVVFNIPVLDDDHQVLLDIMKQKRSQQTGLVPGCFVSNDEIPLRTYATKKNTGPTYLR